MAEPTAAALITAKRTGNWHNACAAFDAPGLMETEIAAVVAER